MHFDLTDDERDLQRGIRGLLEGRFPIDRVRGGVDRTAWEELRAAGVFDVRRGLGLGMTQAALVFEELGRALVPGPLVGTELAGEGAVTLVEDGARYVTHLDVAERVLVVDRDEVRLVDAGAIDARPVGSPLDPLTPVHEIVALPRGEVVGGSDDAARYRRDATVLAAALLLGSSLATTELATRYAQEREQFGRSIGSFQAVKHLCADMLVRAEVARAAVYAAAVMLDDPAIGNPDRAAATAKLLAGDAAVRNGKACVQVHGGMGFTWEVPVHLFLKRAVLLDAAVLSSDDAAETVAATL